MRKWSIWHWAIFIGSLVLSGLLVGGFLTSLCKDGLRSGNAASWMQAIGTVGAIIGAFFVANHQHRKNEELESEKQRLADVRKLRAIKSVLVQICVITTRLNKMMKKSEAEGFAKLDPQFLADYKVILQSFPLFEIPSAPLTMQITLLPRTIEEVSVRLLQVREQQKDAVESMEWLRANDFEKRLKTLHNLAVDANHLCVDEIKALKGFTAEELEKLES